MSTQRNPINTNTIIDLGETLEIIKPRFGFVAESGLFEENGIVSNAHIYKVLEQQDTKMTMLTSYAERDAVAVERAAEKYVTLAGVSNKITGGVKVEDLIGQVTGVFSMENEKVQEAQIKELTRMANAGAANYEYILVGATQGVIRDPKNGNVVHNQYTATGTTRTGFTIDASEGSDIFSELTRLRNTLSDLNGYNGEVDVIEVILGETAFNAVVNHPSFSTLAQLAFSGLGQQTMNNPLLNGGTGLVNQTQYGRSRSFEWDGIVFRTYPRKFTRWNSAQADAVETNKGWTIVRGISDLYHVLFTPSPYFSTYDRAGQKWYAHTKGVVDDTHIDMTIEQHLIPFMKRPEMSLDITVTTA